MRKYLLFILSGLLYGSSFAQNTGIGTTTPKGRLHIKGNADTSQLVIDAHTTQLNTHPLIRLRTAAGADLVHIHSDNADNIFVGLNAGRVNNAAGGALSNTFIGSLAGTANTTGYSNTAVGRGALFSNSSGNENTAIGPSALYYNTIGHQNTALGRGALYQNVDGEGNTSLGFKSLFSNISAAANTAVGWGALQSNIYGEINTALGYRSLILNYDGINNVAIGAHSLETNTTGYQNTAIGTGSDVDRAYSYNNTVVGTFAHLDGNNSTVIGSNAFTDLSNVMFLGDPAVKSVGGYVNWTNYISDGRLKTNVNENVKGLDFIMRLRPVTYHVNIRGLYNQKGISPYGKTNNNNKMTSVMKTDIDKNIADKEAVAMSGFIAQEVEQAAMETGYDFDGIKKPQNSKDNYGLVYSTFVVPLVKAVQEQQAIINDQQQKIISLMSEKDSQQKDLDNLKARLDNIEKLLSK